MRGGGGGIALTARKTGVSNEFRSRFRVSLSIMRKFFKCALVAMVALPMLAGGCARLGHSAKRQTLRTVSLGEGDPFGGAPAVEIPTDAHAMAAFLEAQLALDNGDRATALKAYEDAVRYDPHNARLRVQLATLYVRDGRL